MRPFTAVVVAVHVLALAAYSLPAGWVPARAHYWSEAYARILFHQDWQLFAPDLPACGCVIEVRYGEGGTWVPLKDLHAHFIWRRMAAKACRLAEEIPTERLPRPLEASILNMARTGDTGVDVQAVRLVRKGTACVTSEVPLSKPPVDMLP